MSDLHKDASREVLLDELRREVATGLAYEIRKAKDSGRVVHLLAIAVEFLDDCGVNRPAS